MQSCTLLYVVRRQGLMVSAFTMCILPACVLQCWDLFVGLFVDESLQGAITVGAREWRSDVTRILSFLESLRSWS